MAPLKVEISSRKLIKPSSPTPKHAQKFNLSLFDHLAPPPYINSIFYYSSNSENSRQQVTKKRILLEKSLSEALTIFYPLAGRFVTDPVSVECSDQGVEYLETKVNVTLTHFLQQGPRIELLNQFLPCQLLGDYTNVTTTPMLLIKINVFECGGIVIGVSIWHKIADAFTLFAFVNGWANICRIGSNAMPLLNFQASASLFPVRKFSLIKPLPPLNDVCTKNIVTKRFVLCGNKISEFRSEIRYKHSEGRPTRVVVVMALIWGAIMRVKNGHLKPCLMSSSMNMRQKLGIPKLESCFGNLWTVFNVEFNGNKSKMEMGDLVDLLGHAIRDTSMGFVEQEIDEIGWKVSNAYKELNEKLVNMNNEAEVCLMTSWCNLGMYEADFGWGKPIWVSDCCKPFEVVSLMDQSNGDGIEAWVSLKEEDMLLLELDPCIVDFAS